MANENNLIGHGFHELTASKQREIASMGGVASGKSRRELRAFKECINAILDEDGGEYAGEIVSKRFMIAAKALRYLLEEKDLSAHEYARMFELIRDSVDEKPIDRLQVTELDQSVIDEVEAMVLGVEEEPVEWKGLCNDED